MATTISDENGYFEIETAGYGTYTVKINYLGYEPFSKEITPDRPAYALGIIALLPDSQTLSEVIVEGSRQAFTYGVDRKTVLASAFPEAANAMDLLISVPSLQVSVDGKLTYRDSGTFKVFINGIAVKNGEERLRTLDASQIDKIDIITNPSARYTAEGTAGIIRVLLKKNKLQGYNIGTQADINTLGGYSASYSIDKKGEKSGWHTSGNYQNTTNSSESNGYIINTIRNSTHTLEAVQPTNDKPKFVAYNQFDFGFNYDISPKDLIDFSFYINLFPNKESIKSYRHTTERTFDLNGNEIGRNVFNLTDEYQFKYQQLGGNIDYTHHFNQDKTHLINILFNYGVHIRSSDDFTKQSIYGFGTSEVFGNASSEKNEIYSETTVHYQLPLNENTSVEIGTNIETDNIPEITTNSGFFNGNTIETTIPGIPGNQNIGFKQNVYAAYATFESSWRRLDYKLGLRAEMTDRAINYRYEIASTPHYDPFKARFTDWFPTLHLLYNITDNQQVTLSYSRRIERPNYWHLVPALVMYDRYQYSTGNSRLTPMYINAYEMGYRKSWGKNFVSMEVFARNRRDIFQSFYRNYQDNVLIINRENIGNSWSAGAEWMTGWDPAAWWHTNLSVTAYYFNLRADVGGQPSSVTQWQYNGKWNHRFRLGNGWTTRWNMTYQSATEGLQLKTKSYVNLTGSVTKSIRDNRWQFSVSGWNILNTYTLYKERQDEGFRTVLEQKMKPFYSFRVVYTLDNQK